MRLPVLVAGALFLSGCMEGESHNAIPDCREKLRDQMRDPRGVSIRYLDNEETGENRYTVRFRVRGENGFGATVQQNYVCNWTLVRRTDTGYEYRAFVSRER